MFETKVPFIEGDGAVEIAYMNGHVINAFEHDRYLDGRI
jgi:hypothetical protein